MQFAGEIIVKRFNRPPCANPAPGGGGGACDTLELSALFLFKIDPLIRRYRNPGMPQRRGQSPGERQKIFTERQKWYVLILMP